MSAKEQAPAAWNFDPDFADPTVNMYGFTACPKCKGKCRYSMIATPTVAQCDDCDFRERIKAKPAL